MTLSLLGLDPGSYKPSALHHPSRLFPENNCYADLWIELLHSRGLEPASALGSACGVDFEGDQWTFYKPLPEELLLLFGIDVHEMQLYRDTVDHVCDQLAAGRTITIEVDSYYLPDTAATTYRRTHSKSSIAIEAINQADRRLRYFHAAGYYELSDDDFCGVFRLERKFCDDVLPPYVELVRFDAGPRLDGCQLKEEALRLLRQTRAHKPKRNPWLAFRDRLVGDMPTLLGANEDSYHAYAFATVRQCGAAFELAKDFVEWVAPPACIDAGRAAQALQQQAAGAKTLLFKLARRRRFDPTRDIEQLAESWEEAMSAIDSVASGRREVLCP